MRNLPKSVAELQSENVSFELECIDRMYLNDLSSKTRTGLLLLIEVNGLATALKARR